MATMHSHPHPPTRPVWDWAGPGLDGTLGTALEWLDKVLHFSLSSPGNRDL